MRLGHLTTFLSNWKYGKTTLYRQIHLFTGDAFHVLPCTHYQAILLSINFALEITGAMQGTSREKIYQELGLESLRARRWYKCISCMFKIVKEETPNYLINLIPKIQQTTRTRINRMPTFHCRTDCFKNSFFPSTLNDW